MRKIPGDKNRKRPKQKQRAADSASERRFRSHPLYGEIPLLPYESVYQGEVRTFWDLDPDWQPALPKGAVRGNPREQHFCGYCHFPKYFYLDETRRCVQCGEDFVFTADEQKFWYENLKFNFHSTAIRCRDCRRQRRSVKALQRSLEAAAAQLEQSGEDPLVQLAYAEALIEYRRASGSGDLTKALSACRKARKLDSQLGSAWFLEAEALLLTGQPSKAAEAYRAYLEKPASKPAWARAARQWLDQQAKSETPSI